MTVAVLAEPSEHELRIDPADLEGSFNRRTGKGYLRGHVRDLW